MKFASCKKNQIFNFCVAILFFSLYRFSSRIEMTSIMYTARQIPVIVMKTQLVFTLKKSKHAMFGKQN